MTRDDIDKLWNQALDQSIAAGEKFTRHSFVELLKRQMILDGWRQCAEGQRATQACSLVEDALKAEREGCRKIAVNMQFSHSFTPPDCTAYNIASAISARGRPR